MPYRCDRGRSPHRRAPGVPPPVLCEDVPAALHPSSDQGTGPLPTPHHNQTSAPTPTRIKHTIIRTREAASRRSTSASRFARARSVAASRARRCWRFHASGWAGRDGPPASTRHSASFVAGWCSITSAIRASHDRPSSVVISTSSPSTTNSGSAAWTHAPHEPSGSRAGRPSSMIHSAPIVRVNVRETAHMRMLPAETSGHAGRRIRRARQGPSKRAVLRS